MRKNIFILLILSGFIASCGFDDEVISYGTTSVYFYNQEYNRNIVVGEGLNLKAGIMFSGELDNTKDRAVNYIIDESLVTDDALTLLPEEYYTLSDASKFLIEKGEEQGYVEIVIDSVAFVNDPKALTGEYVLPFRLIQSSDVDSINADKDYMIMSISYWAKQHGNYYYSGQTIRKQGGEVVDTLNYEYVSSNSESCRQLITVGYNTMQLIADESSSSKDPLVNKLAFYLEVPTLGGGEVAISNEPDAAIEISANGASTYDEANKIFYLNYKYNDGTYDCFALDTLEFRNRIRDVQSDGQGVNEWRGF